ncbi:MAG: hypothetical protein KJ579_07950 [Verrucomicrobia bacterium]|nr:hypothetical protein [Verrucomicrobiota bacterium]
MNLFPIIADTIERDPAILDRAVETLEHWEAGGMAPAPRLAQWRDLLGAARRTATGLTTLLCVLRDDSPGARRLKDFAPFAGILTREQRRTVFMSCSYDH